MKGAKNVAYRILFCVGILLMVAYTFVPVFNLDFDKLQKDITGTVSDFAGLIDESIDEDFVESLIDYTVEQSESNESVDKINKLSLSDVYMYKGAVKEEIENEWDGEELAIVRKVLMCVSIVLFYIPIVILVTAGVLFFVKKTTRIAFGLSIGNMIYILTFNLFIYIGANKFVNETVKEGMDILGDVVKDVFTVSLLPFVLLIIGMVLCTVMAVLLLTCDKEREKASLVFDGQTAVLACIEGQLSGAEIPLVSGVPQIIGREGKFAQIVLDEDSKASRRHCQVEFVGKENKVYVTDFSSNGTRLGDGTRLVKGARTPVNNGTVLVVSPQSKFVVRY